MTPELESLAIDLFTCRAVKFGSFKLKLHEKKPDAPLSPVYLNIRTPDHPTDPGPVTPEIVEKIGAAFDALLIGRRVSMGAICGIPHAATPLARALRKKAENSGRLPGAIPLVTLTKETQPNGSRRITSASKPNTNRRAVVLVDDVITKADSKIEALDALSTAGWMPVCVMVVVDRCQGGAEELLLRGTETYALFNLHDLVQLYARRGLIAPDMYERVVEYLLDQT